jgi:hypothetical protein
MLAATNVGLTLFVDRATRQWVVRDAEGQFWTVPSTDDAWEHREPFSWADDTDLAQVPGHYKHLLRLPN